MANTANQSAQLRFSPQQVRAIRNAPKGKVPPFVTAGIGTGPGVVSVGGRVGNIGGAIGMQNGKPFGSANVGGKIVGKFGQ